MKQSNTTHYTEEENKHNIKSPNHNLITVVHKTNALYY